MLGVLDGVRVNAVCPSFIRTAMYEGALERSPKIAAWTEKANPLERVGEPEEIANGIIWLLSDAASFVHGHALTLDGGMVIR
jgi:NAD(P)-dependent dehydrogenase (short-subunit alcohol dehydrogenase family)